jgi:uncharacterized membrane protein YccC
MVLGMIFATIDTTFEVLDERRTTHHTRQTWERFRQNIQRVVFEHAQRPGNPLGALTAVQADLEEYKKLYEERGDLLREALQEMERLEEDNGRLLEQARGISARAVKKTFQRRF